MKFFFRSFIWYVRTFRWIREREKKRTRACERASDCYVATFRTFSINTGISGIALLSISTHITNTHSIYTRTPFGALTFGFNFVIYVIGFDYYCYYNEMRGCHISSHHLIFFSFVVYFSFFLFIFFNNIVCLSFDLLRLGIWLCVDGCYYFCCCCCCYFFVVFCLVRSLSSAFDFQTKTTDNYYRSFIWY